MHNVYSDVIGSIHEFCCIGFVDPVQKQGIKKEGCFHIPLSMIYDPEIIISQTISQF